MSYTLRPDDPRLHSGDVRPDVPEYIRMGTRVLLRDTQLDGDLHRRRYGGHHARLPAANVYEQGPQHRNLPGAIVVFGVALWLVRSQVTVSGESYMRAMIPHHSIAIMTSERARIEDPRVRKLANEIIVSQSREIAEMQALINDNDAVDVAVNIYRDPAAAPGTVQDALSNTLISQLDLAPMTADEAAQVLDETPACRFFPTDGSDPFLWIARGDGAAAAKLNGVLLSLVGMGADSGVLTYTAAGTTLTVLTLGGEASSRADAELVFELDQCLRVAYRGIYDCPADNADRIP